MIVWGKREGEGHVREKRLMVSVSIFFFHDRVSYLWTESENFLHKSNKLTGLGQTFLSDQTQSDYNQTGPKTCIKSWDCTLSPSNAQLRILKPNII